MEKIYYATSALARRLQMREWHIRLYEAGIMYYDNGARTALLSLSCRASQILFAISGTCLATAGGLRYPNPP